jgi:hypothetical protein
MEWRGGYLIQTSSLCGVQQDAMLAVSACSLHFLASLPPFLSISLWVSSITQAKSCQRTSLDSFWEVSIWGGNLQTSHLSHPVAQKRGTQRWVNDCSYSGAWGILSPTQGLCFHDSEINPCCLYVWISKGFQIIREVIYARAICLHNKFIKRSLLLFFPSYLSLPEW